MNYYIIIVAIACFIYGALGLLTSSLPGNNMKSIAEKHKKLYSKLCGAMLLLTSLALVVLYYLLKQDLLYGIVKQPLLLSIYLILSLSPAVIIIIFGRVFRKK